LILASRIAKVSDSDNYDEIVRAALKVFRSNAKPKPLQRRSLPLFNRHQ